MTARYLANGDPDSSFGSNGVVFTNIPGTEEVAYGIHFFGDRACAAGTVRTSRAARPRDRQRSSTHRDVFVVCYRDDRSLDTSFSGDGIRIVDIDDKNDEGRDIAFDSQGRIVIAGFSESRVNDSCSDSQRENVLTIRLLPSFS